MVDVAIQGLVHSKDEFRHATKSPPQVFQNNLSRRSAEVSWTRSARRIVSVTNNPRSGFGRKATDALDPDSTTLIKVILIRGNALSAASDKQGPRDSTQ
jgi:hypothetical protein